MNSLLIWLLIVACLYAAVLEARCLRDPCIPDNALSLAGRRIKITGYVILAGRFLLAAMQGVEISWLGGFALLLVAFSDIVRCSNRLTLPRSLLGGAEQ